MVSPIARSRYRFVIPGIYSPALRSSLALVIGTHLHY